MKRKTFILCMLVVAGMVLAACGGAAEEAPAAAEPVEEVAAEEEAAPTVLKVAVAIPASQTDQGWNQQGADSAIAMANNLGLEIEVAENLGYGDITPVLRDLADRGFDMVICHASGYQTVCPEVAAETGMHVVVVENPGAVSDLVADVETQAQEVSYLAGVLAGKLTSGTVGVVVSGEPPTWNFMTVGFAEGVASVNPGAEVLYSVIGEAAYEDAAGAKRVTEAQLAAGADIIFGMGDGASFGMVQAIQEHNASGGEAWFIDVIGDKSADYSDVLLTSVLWDYTNIYTQMVNNIGGDYGQVYTMDVASGDVRLLDLPDWVPADIAQAVDDAKAAILSGDVSVSAVSDSGVMQARLASLKSAGSVKVGVLNPTTGGLAIFGEQSNSGIRLFFASVDHKVGGTPVDLIFADTAGDPQQALDQARRLVEEEEVDFLMGVVNSAVVVPMAEYADTAQVPLLIVIGGATAATGPERSPYVFRVSMANGQQDRPLGWYAASELGLGTAATFAWDFLVGAERADAFTSIFVEAGGDVVSEQKPPLGTVDYGPFISQVDPTEIDGIYAFFAGPGAISFLQQLGEFGVTPSVQIVASGYLTAGVLDAMGETAIGLVQATQYTPVLENLENASFLSLYDGDVGGEPGVYVEEGYLGGQVASAAIAAVNGNLTDKEAFLGALASVTLDTPAGPFRFDDHGQAVRNTYITRVVSTDDGVEHEVIDTIEDVAQTWAP
jgi:simple sugar transport system substrate-binding protein